MDAQFILDREAIKALSVDSRLDILKLLAERPHTLSELAASLELSPGTVTEHLVKLESVDLIRKNDEGRKWKYYALTTKGRSLFSTRGTGFFLSFAITAIAAAGTAAFSLMTRLRPDTALDAAIVPFAERSTDEVAAIAMADAAPVAPGPDWLLIAAIGLFALSLAFLLLARSRRFK